MGTFNFPPSGYIPLLEERDVASPPTSYLFNLVLFISVQIDGYSIFGLHPILTFYFLAQTVSTLSIESSFYVS